MIEWPRPIIRDIARRRSVLFLGAGISRNSVGLGQQRPPTWEEFLRKALEQVQGDKAHIEQLLIEKDYLTSCEIIVGKLGIHNFNEIAVESFLRPRFDKHNIHESIFKLDSSIVATPNVDKIYDTYSNQESRGTILVKNYYDEDLADKIRSHDRIIIKVHGTIEYPSKMIFTRKQYTNARYEYAAFYQILNALVLTHTFIFLGCGFSDPDIRLLLENYAFIYPNCRPHYMITPSDNINSDMIRTIKENSNLELITYDSSNNHIELVSALSNLVEQVEIERSELAKTINW